MNQTTESFATLDAGAVPFRHCRPHWLRRREGQRPVRPMAIVVINEDAKDTVEMRGVENKQPIETL